MSDPKEIYLEPKCCADPYTGRTWAADQPWEHSPECMDHQPATRYVRADIHEAALKQQESEREANALLTAENERLQEELRRRAVEEVGDDGGGNRHE